MKHLLLALALLISLSLFSQEKTNYEKGLIYTANDNSFSLQFALRIQPLFSTNFRDFEKFDQPELTEISMMVRRARLKFDGHVFDPNIIYKFELAFGNRNIGVIDQFTNMGARIILDAVIKYQFTDNFSVWFGQTKLPGNRERVVSSQKLQFVDRNLVNSRFNIDRDMGFQIHGKHKTGTIHYRTAFAFSMGEGRNITDVNMGGFKYTFRGEILPFGEFKDYSQADIERETTPKLAIGATYDLHDRAVRARGNQGSWMLPDGEFYTNNLNTLWLDFMFKLKGWSITGEYANKTSDKSAQVFDSNGDLYNTYYIGQGINLQSGYVFKSNWEIAGRYTHLVPDELVTNKVNQYTLCISKYIVGHKLKIQSDISFSDYSSFNGMTHTDPVMYRFQVEIGL